MTKKREGRSCKKASLGVTDLVAAANLVLIFSFWTDFTKSAYSQTRKTDSVLASLETSSVSLEIILSDIEDIK